MGLLDTLGMSWPTATLCGVKLFEGEGKAWLHAICQAVNERQAAIDITKTEWILADGSEAADPVLADFDGIRVHGDDSPVRINMERAQNAIEAMLNAGYFTEASGYSDPWTVGSIVTDMGLGAFEFGDVQFHSLNYWAQMKEALDRMIYARRGVVFSPSGATVYRKSGLEGSPNDAWNEMYADSESSAAANTGQLGWSVAAAGGFSVAAVATRLIENIAITNSFSGVLSAIGYTVTNGLSNYAGSIDVSIGSESFTFSGAGSVEVINVSGDLPLGSVGYVDFEITTTLPSSNPFSTGGGPPYVGSISSIFGGTYFYFDIAGELTDQA